MDSCIQLFFWLVQTSRTLRVGGEPRCLSALLCIARIPDFKRVVLLGVADFWSVFFLLWKVLKLASEFGFLWVSSIFEDWHGLKKESKNRGFGVGLLIGLNLGPTGTDSFGFAYGWHQCESEYGGAIGVVGDVLDAKRSGSNPKSGLQVSFCRYLATDYNRKNQITTSSIRIAFAACLIRCTSKLQLCPRAEMSGARWTFLPDCCFTVLWMWLEVLF